MCVCVYTPAHRCLGWLALKIIYLHIMCVRDRERWLAGGSCHGLAAGERDGRQCAVVMGQSVPYPPHSWAMPCPDSS